MACLISHLVSFSTAGPVPKLIRGISASSPTVTVGMSTKLYTLLISSFRPCSVSPSSSQSSVKVLQHKGVGKLSPVLFVTKLSTVVWAEAAGRHQLPHMLS